MKLLVTGGAGFIGSNFVHYWLANHAGDEVVVYDLLTYAGNRDNLAAVEGHHLRAGRHRRPAAGRAHAERPCHRRRRQLRGGVAQQLRHHRPRSLRPHQRPGHPDPVGGGPAGGRAALPPHLHRARSTATSTSTATRRSTRTRPTRRTPYNASKAAADHFVRAYFETFEVPITITNCANNYGPYQFPEKVVPLFTTYALDDKPLPLYASTQNRREWIHAIDHCRAIDMVLADGPGRRDLPRGHRRGEEHRGDRRPGAGRPRQAGQPEDDRARPPGPRPALPARRHQDPQGAGLGADHPVRPGPGRHGVVVRRQPDWWEPLRGRAPVVEEAWGRRRAWPTCAS